MARWCNRYPDISVTYELAGGPAVAAGEPVSLAVAMERDGGGGGAGGEVPPADAPLYPGRKEENWWLVVGDPGSNTLLAIKRVALGRKARVKLDFLAPGATEPEIKMLTLFLMCDSYLGCDQEFELALEVAPAAEEEGGGQEGAEAMDDD